MCIDLQKTDIQHVPYNGDAPVNTDRIGRQLIAPTTSKARVLQVPVESWTAFMAPASKPEALVANLSVEVLRIMATPDMDERGSAQGFHAEARGPHAFGRFLGDEILYWSRISAAAMITTEQCATAGPAPAEAEACRADC